MPQCLPASSNAVSATENPINMIVGATVSGPMKRNSTLTIPLAPITVSKIAATMMLPTSCHKTSARYLQMSSNIRTHTVGHVCTAKIQICSDSSLSTFWIVKDGKCLIADNEDSNQPI